MVGIPIGCQDALPVASEVAAKFIPCPLATVTSPSVSVRPFATVVSLFSSTDIIGVVPTAL